MSIDDGLRDRVRQLLAGYLDGEAPDGDLVTEPAAIRCGTAIVYLRLVEATHPVLRVFSPLLRGVDQSSELLAELNELNARISFLRLFWREGTVYAALELLARTLTSEVLAHACDTMADAADYYDERLQPRFGGEKAYADRS